MKERSGFIKDFGPSLVGLVVGLVAGAIEVAVTTPFKDQIMQTQEFVLNYLFGPMWPSSVLALGCTLAFWLSVPIGLGFAVGHWMRKRIGPPSFTD